MTTRFALSPRHCLLIAGRLVLILPFLLAAPVISWAAESHQHNHKHAHETVTTDQSQAPLNPVQAAKGDIQVTATGLVCDFCARALEKVFRKDPAVANIHVDLSNSLIRIDLKPGHTLSGTKVRRLVQDAGYNISEISGRGLTHEN